MAQYIRHRVDTEAERRMLTGLIVSDRICREVLSLVNKDYLQNPYSPIIVDWIRNYWIKYQKAPGQHIQDIFEVEKKNIHNDRVEMVAGFLERLSEEYEKENINEPYLIDQCIEYLDERSLLDLSQKIETNVANGDKGKAKSLLTDYHKVARQMSTWSNPFSIEEVNLTMDAEKDVMFQMPGALGKLLGPFERGTFVAVMAPVKKGKCIVEGSFVVLPDGSLKKIEEVYKKGYSKTLSLQKDGKLSFGEIVGRCDDGIKPVFKIITKTGRSIEMTQNDPLFTMSGWIPLSELKIGDYIAVPRKYNIFGEDEWPDYQLKLLAYLLADGGLTDNTPTFTKQNKKIQNDFFDCVQKMGDTTKPTKDVDWMFYIVKDTLKKDPTRLSNTTQWLRGLGIGKCKSKSKEFPQDLFKLNKKSLSLFLATLFTCDGSIYKLRKGIVIEYSSASEILIRQLSHLLLRFGIVHKIGKNVVKEISYWSIIIKDRENILKFLDEIGFLFHKQEKAESFISLIKSKREGRGFLDVFPVQFSYWLRDVFKKENIPLWAGSDELLPQSLKTGGCLSRHIVEKIVKKVKDDKIKEFVDSDILWDKVVFIEYTGEKRTYDLAIKGTHNFIANDIVVHNTWFLMEIAIIALLQRLRVAFISLEMKKEKMQQRIYKRLISTAQGKGSILYPCFDCYRNQEGTCDSVERRGRGDLIEKKDGENVFFKKYDSKIDWTPCDICRGRKGGDFVPAASHWYISVERPGMDLANVRDYVTSVKESFGDNLRLKCYPRFSANLEDIERDLDLLEYTENFIPDVIIVDYADILKPENQMGDKLDMIDETWMRLAQIGDKRKALLVTATQSNREAWDAKTTKAKNVGQYFMKFAHVEMAFMLSQTPLEKKNNIIRCSVAVSRNEDFNENYQVRILQQLQAGQPLIDSEFEVF